MSRTYNRSTLALAQGVLRRNLRLDVMEGFSRKQRIETFPAKNSQPYFAWRSVTIRSRVIPCSGSLFLGSVMVPFTQQVQFNDVRFRDMRLTRKQVRQVAHAMLSLPVVGTCAFRGSPAPLLPGSPVSS